MLASAVAGTTEVTVSVGEAKSAVRVACAVLWASERLETQEARHLNQAECLSTQAAVSQQAFSEPRRSEIHIKLFGFKV